MADETELNELRERIGKLNGRDQGRLLELVLIDNRRRVSEVQAENLIAERELLDAESRAERAALESQRLQQLRIAVHVEKRKA